ALVECELGVAVRAAPAIVRPGCAARRTAHDPRVVSLRLLNGQDVPTVTAKLAAGPPPARVVLAMAYRAGDEQTHGELRRSATVGAISDCCRCYTELFCHAPRVFCDKNRRFWIFAIVAVVRSGSLSVLRFFRRHFDVPGQMHPGEDADDPVAHVDLPPAQAVAGRGREGVMRVVPAFSQPEN